MADQSVKDRVGGVISQAKRRVGAEAPSAADDDGRVGIVRGALRAFGTGDLDGFLDTLKEDVRWEAPEGKKFPGAGTHSGRDAVKTEFIDAVGRTYTSFGFRPDSFLDADQENSVMAIGAINAEGVDGATIDVPTVLLWEFEGNSASRVVIFTDTAAFPKPVTENEQAERDKSDGEDDEPQAKRDDGEETKRDEGKPQAKRDDGEETKRDEDEEQEGDVR